MKILRCDCCHAEVNDYSKWSNGSKPRSMYELHCIHEYDSDTYEGMIFCSKCIDKLIDLGDEKGASNGKDR